MTETNQKNINEIQNGEKTINQVRAENDLHPIAGGDELIITKAQSDNN